MVFECLVYRQLAGVARFFQATRLLGLFLVHKKNTRKEGIVVRLEFQTKKLKTEKVLFY
jgi:hypothetical protein